MKYERSGNRRFDSLTALLTHLIWGLTARSTSLYSKKKSYSQEAPSKFSAAAHILPAPLFQPPPGSAARPHILTTAQTGRWSFSFSCTARSCRTAAADALAPAPERNPDIGGCDGGKPSAIPYCPALFSVFFRFGKYPSIHCRYSSTVILPSSQSSRRRMAS